MRVITGAARGRKLKEPKGFDVRPTTDMVKESMFNIIQYDIEGRRVLDLFAGTGQLGIEALSRGAAEVVFVDESISSVKLVRENLATCGFSARVEQAEAVSFLDHGGKYDLVFLDPPYDSGLLDSVLHKIQNIDILNDGGIIICESRREKSVPPLSEPYYLLSERNYGKIKITVCGKRANT
ncbi:MAG: 16S rRNA (guanine(966)-N(2))-methyltransferase RsmD [Clostridia bacterium]|nr:16S rRNA (guanine(966)-N(2))-methyltransferase RsmD [Clostridia bacterium]